MTLAAHHHIPDLRREVCQLRLALPRGRRRRFHLLWQMGRNGPSGGGRVQTPGMGARSTTDARGTASPHSIQKFSSSAVATQCIEAPTRWAIHVVEDLPFAAFGSVALLGDAVRRFPTARDTHVSL